MSDVATQSLHEEAVAHASLAERSGDLMWQHIESEYTQDPHKIAATLATDAPLAWTLANSFSADGSVRFLTGTTVDEIREQYQALREFIEIHNWAATLEIRQGWYTVTQGVCTSRHPATGQTGQGQTVTMFPVGGDGVLGELQPGIVGLSPDGRPPLDDERVPHKRLASLARHEAYVDALRAEDVDSLVGAHVDKTAVTIRSYLTDESTLLNANGAAELADYFTALFARYRVRDVRLVNRIAETWYAFAELHWIVEERTGPGRALEFCTAELAPFDAEGKYLIRTGAGTDPVEV